MYKNKKSGIIGVIVTVVIIVLLVILTNVENSNLSYIESIANKLVNPVQNGLTNLKNKLNGNSSFFEDINTLKDENSKLKERNSKLEESLRELETIKSQNETLKQYVQLAEKFSNYSTIPADVINRDISNYSKTIVINAGTNDGVKENMTVIAAEGLVGYVISASNTTSKVQTIIDSSSNTSALFSTSREAMVCKGILKENKSLKAVYISTNATVTEGDSVETSGLGGIYPKGIHIGVVSRVVNTKNLSDRYSVIDTAVDFGKLETVLVIKGNK